jgi:cation transport regulator
MNEDVMIPDEQSVGQPSSSGNISAQQTPNQNEGPETPKGSYKNISDLPQDVRNVLPEDAQHIFMTAFNSIIDNHGDEQTATRVAWETLKRDDNYVQGADGKWTRPDQTSEGNHGVLSTMSGS